MAESKSSDVSVGGRTVFWPNRGILTLSGHCSRFSLPLIFSRMFFLAASFCAWLSTPGEGVPRKMDLHRGDDRTVDRPSALSTWSAILSFRPCHLPLVILP